MYSNVFIIYELSYTGYTAVARLGFKRRATAVLKSNLIRSIEIGKGSSTTFETGLRACLHGVGDPGLVGLVSFVFTLWGTQNKRNLPH